MSDENQIIISGNLVKMPELRYTAGGTAVTSLRLASNDGWTDKRTGEAKEDTLFIDCEVFDKSAEAACQHITAIGTKLYIRGQLKEDSWTDKQGNKRFNKKIKVLRWMFMGSKKERTGDEPAAAPSTPPQEIKDSELPW